MTTSPFSRLDRQMRLVSALACALVIGGLGAFLQTRPVAATGPEPRLPATRLARATLLSEPLHFEPNRGQVDPGVLFVAHGRGYDLRLDAAGASLRLTRGRDSKTVRLVLAGGSRATNVVAKSELPARVHYLLGRDQRRWIRDVPTYGRIQYQNVYPGVDMILYGNQRRLEYDFRLAAGADPAGIRFSFQGSDGLTIDRAGQLLVAIGGRQLEQAPPVVYQEIGGARVPVSSRYRLIDTTQVGFALGAYDHTRPLVIDPLVLGWSTYLGGEGSDKIEASAVNSKGELVVVGSTENEATWKFEAFGQGPLGSLDAFVSRFKSDGTLLSTTFFGGGGNDTAAAVAVDPQDNIYITGTTTSLTFPTTANAAMPESESLQVSLTAGIPFLDLISLPDIGTGAVGDADAFVMKLDPDGRAAKYSSYLGGSPDIGAKLSVNPISEKVKIEFSANPGIDTGDGIAVDAAGNAYIVGTTDSEAFPVTPNAFKSSLNGFLGASDGFITKIDTNGSGASSIKFSSYLGGSCDEEATGVAVDDLGEVFVTGDSDSSFACGGFTTTSGAAHQDRIGEQDAWVMGMLLGDKPGVVFSTFIGTPQIDHGGRVGVDPFENVYASYVADDDIGAGGELHVVELSRDGTTEAWDKSVGPTTRSTDPLSFHQLFPTDLFTPGPDLQAPVFAVANAGGPNLYEIDSAGHVAFHALGLGGATTVAASVAADGRRVYVSGATTSDAIGVTNAAQAVRTGGVEAFAAAYTYNPPPQLTGASLSVSEGTVLTGTLATFPITTGTDPSVFSETVDWGDGSAPSVQDRVSMSGTQGAISGTHTYGRAGTFTGSACVTEIGIGGDPTCSAFTVRVQNIAPTVTPDSTTGATITAGTPGVSFEPSGSGFKLAIGTIADFSDPGFGESHSATITWGDGTPAEAAAISQNQSSGRVINASHVYPAGTLAASLTVCVTDEFAASTCTTLTLQVPTADVQVTATAPESAAAGSTIDYDVKVTNAGPDTAQNVLLRHTLATPSSMRYIASLLLGATGDGTVTNETRLPGSGQFSILGIAAAMDGSTAVVTSESAAYVYERDPVTFQWRQASRITTNAEDAAAIEGDWMVLARRGFNLSETNHVAGYAEVYHRVGGQWTGPVTLHAPVTDDEFGTSVAVGGNIIVVGDPQPNTGRNGAAYVYQYDGTAWNYLFTLSGSDSGRMGQSVAVSRDGSWIAVGEPQYVGTFPPTLGFGLTTTTGGIVNILHHDDSGWQQTVLYPPLGILVGEEFGDSVAFDKTSATPRLAAGAPKGDFAGAAYVFELAPHDAAPPTWRMLGHLFPNDGVSGEQFGRSVDISANRVLVGTGAGWGKADTSNSPNRAYLFSPGTDSAFGDDVWVQTARFLPANGTPADDFGNAVAMSGGGIVIGAPGGQTSYATVYSSCMQPTGDGSIQCDVGSLAPGQSAEFLLSVQLGPGLGDGDTASATASATAGVVDATLSNNSVTTDTQIVGSVPAGTDFTPPIVTPTVTGHAGNNGWYTSTPVTVAWTVEDPESAILNSSAGCTTATVSTETSGVTFTCSATSLGGTTTRSVTVKIDTHAPTATPSGPPTADPNQPGTFDIPFQCEDPAVDGVSSGLAFSPLCQYGGTTDLMTKTVPWTRTVSDQAGNTTTVSLSIPTANAGPAQTITAAPGQCAVPVTLHGSGFSPVPGDPLTYTWSEQGLPIATGPQATVTLAAGIHVLALTVTNPAGLSDSSTTTVTVVDNAPPVFTGVVDHITADATGIRTPVNVPMPTATACGPIQVTSDAPADGFLAGDTNVFFTATEPGGQTATAVTRVTVRPRVDVGVSIAPASLMLGTPGTVSFSVENKGPSPASSIIVRPTFPAGISPVPIDSGEQTCVSDGNGGQTCTPLMVLSKQALCLTAPDGLECVVDHLDPNGSASFDLTFALANTVTLRGAQAFQATATPAETDTNPSDNTTSGNVTIVSQSDLTLSLSAPASAVAGTTMTEAFAITNLGPSDSSGFTVTQTLPAGVLSASGPGCSVSGATLTCTGPAIAVGAAQIPVVLTVDPARRQPIALAATVTGLDVDTNAANNSGSASVAVTAQADLGVSLSAGPSPEIAGGQVTYTLTAVNAGPSSAIGAVASATLPAGITFISGTGCSVSGQVVSCPLDTLAPGASRSLVVVAKADPFARGTLAMSASITGEPGALDPQPGNNAASLVNVLTADVDLGVTLSASAGPATAGTPVTYTAVVTNQGLSGSTGSTVTLPLATGATFTTTTGCSVSGGAVTCSIGQLGPGASTTLVLPVTIDPFARNTVTQTVTIAPSAAGETDANPANDTAAVTTPVVASADVMAVLVSTPNPVTAGTSLSYTLTITNAGPSGVTAPVVSQTLPSGVTLQSPPGACTVSGDAATGETLTCTLGSLAPNANTSLTLLTSVDGFSRGMLSSTASVTAAEADPDSTNNTTTSTTPVTTSADLHISLTAAPASVPAGSRLIYQVHVANAGPSGATAVTVTDHVPSGLGIPAAALPTGCTVADGTLTCTTDRLASGATTDYALSVLPMSAGLLADTVTVTATETDPNPADNTASVNVEVTSQAGGPAGAADFNGDGALDIAIADADSDAVHIWLNNGDGTFNDAQTVDLASSDHGGRHGDHDDAVGDDGHGPHDHDGFGDDHGGGRTPPGIALGDFDGDGHVDIAVANWRTNQVDILSNDGTGRFALTAEAAISGRAPVAITAGDLNGDGAVDLAVASRVSDDVSLLLNDSQGGFAETAVVSLRTSGDDDRDRHEHHEEDDARADLGPSCRQPSAIAAGDFDGDGQVDLAVACRASDSITMLTNRETEGFVLSSVRLAHGDGPAALSAGDFNGDGRLDLAVANRQSSGVAVLLNAGTAAGLPELVQTAAPTRVGHEPVAVAAGDLNGDGAADLVTANRGADSVSVLLNDGTGAFPQALSVEAPACRQPVAVTLGDFTGDGTTDIVVIDRPRLAPVLLTSSPAPPDRHPHGHGPDHGEKNGG